MTRTIEMTHSLRTSAGLARALPGHRGLRPLRRASPRSCRPWPAPPTAASSPSTRSTSSSSPSCSSRTATRNPSHYSRRAGLRGGHGRRGMDEHGLLRPGDRRRTGTRSWAASATWSPSTSSDLSPKFNGGRRDQRHQPAARLPGAVGEPDALDSIVPMAFGNLALDLVLEGRSGLLVSGAQRRVQPPSPSTSDHGDQEDRGRGSLLRRRPAAPQVRASEGVPLHHDQRELIGPGQRHPPGAARAACAGLALPVACPPG
ncbi:MAG: hypothetical protein MZV70_08100 [Desulfobacterales bacterium]|nr:hypothetical protein [Desulfobacterales bacterium]